MNWRTVGGSLPWQANRTAACLAPPPRHVGGTHPWQANRTAEGMAAAGAIAGGTFRSLANGLCRVWLMLLCLTSCGCWGRPEATVSGPSNQRAMADSDARPAASNDEAARAAADPARQPEAEPVTYASKPTDATPLVGSQPDSSAVSQPATAPSAPMAAPAPATPTQAAPAIAPADHEAISEARSGRRTDPAEQTERLILLLAGGPVLIDIQTHLPIPESAGAQATASPDAVHTSDSSTQSGTSPSWQFVLRPASMTPNNLRGDSGLGDWLDRDDDGILQPDELESAASRLSQQDQNDDGLLTLNELLGTRGATEMAMQRRRPDETDVALHLGVTPAWDRVRDQLEERYAFEGSRVNRGDWPQADSLFQQLDRNQDDELQADELPRLAETGADWLVVIDFRRSRPALGPRATSTPDAVRQATDGPRQRDDTRPTRPAEPHLQLIPIARLPATATTGGPIGDNVASAPPKKELANTTSGSNNSEVTPSGDSTSPASSSRTEPAGQPIVAWTVSGTQLEFLARVDPLLAHPGKLVERLFNLLDRDASQDLTPEELPDAIGLTGSEFTTVDQNADGRLNQDELTAALLARQNRLATQVTATAVQLDDPLFAIADRNHDERLDEREIVTASAHLRQLDRDGDGQLARHEIPARLRVTLWHGEVPSPFANALLDAPVPSQTLGRLPAWFQAMDANRDGRIAEREFLGTLIRFAEFDRDRNGFWDPEEWFDSDASVAPMP